MGLLILDLIKPNLHKQQFVTFFKYIVEFDTC